MISCSGVVISITNCYIHVYFSLLKLIVTLQIIVRSSTMSSITKYVGLTAMQIISMFKMGSIRRVFPGQYLEVLFEVIQKEAKDGVKAAMTALKLLISKKYDK